MAEKQLYCPFLSTKTNFSWSVMQQIASKRQTVDGLKEPWNMCQKICAKIRGGSFGWLSPLHFAVALCIYFILITSAFCVAYQCCHCLRSTSFILCQVEISVGLIALHSVLCFSVSFYIYVSSCVANKLLHIWFLWIELLVTFRRGSFGLYYASCFICYDSHKYNFENSVQEMTERFWNEPK